MILATRLQQALSMVAAFAALVVLVCQMATGQQSPPTNWTAEQDHQNMMDQLGIKALRAGPSGNERDPNHANYDEEKANPYGDLPDALTLKSGKKSPRRNSGGSSDAPRLSKSSSARSSAASHPMYLK